LFFVALRGLLGFGSGLVPYSRISVTQFSPPQSVWIKKNPHALRGIKNKKAEECIEIINLNIPPRHLSPTKHGDYEEYPLVGC
jgi:hypothetical protein